MSTDNSSPQVARSFTPPNMTSKQIWLVMCGLMLAVLDHVLTWFLPETELRCSAPGKASSGEAL